MNGLGHIVVYSPSLSPTLLLSLSLSRGLDLLTVSSRNWQARRRLPCAACARQGPTRLMQVALAAVPSWERSLSYASYTVFGYLSGSFLQRPTFTILFRRDAAEDVRLCSAIFLSGSVAV